MPASPPIPPHTSPACTLYHSKRLKNPQTKDAFTSALAQKVAKISHTFSRLTTQLHNSKITPQSFADTANAALSEILQHAAHVVLGKVEGVALRDIAGVEGVALRDIEDEGVV